ncbi:class I SAM-dependent methyltransferase [Streptomyces smaragdinus]|uniref:class I SAM-dependent methyltransferase n=1 Tax=Streptomyces smaragdinus TaxID=2585196 RepID=UPI002B1FC792|nr:class I SAM-dependent methyltransferase [Streptomyces smaragdinus]
MDRTIRTTEDVLNLLDTLFTPAADRWTEDSADWWDAFYADRARGIPFFVAKPDENLASYLTRDLLKPPGRALELGCGPGRNALHLAAHGYAVEAVDLSPTAITWATERAEAAAPDIRARVHFHRADIFTLPAPTTPYDLIVDSGCFHHLPPHRRISYLALLDRALAPGGHFALTCFAPDENGGGSSLPDEAFYRDASLHGGLGYTAEALRGIFADLTEVELRRMNDEPPASPYFGEPFLWTALFHRPLHPV